MWTRRGVVSAIPLSVLTTIAAGPRGVAQQNAPRPDLYDCEDCDGLLDRMPDPASLSGVSRIAPVGEPGEPLVLRGRVLAPGGAAPVPGIVVYAYHTDIEGVYREGPGDTIWGRRHGQLRGWTITGADGAYQFHAIKPAQYPGGGPAHIHVYVLEPGRPPYWLDSVVFAGEPGVTEEYRREAGNRGGSGIVQLTRTPGGEWLAERDIILEIHPG
jgi:protocatechuate 3,4-dioxygenase beta subunit